MKDEEMTLLDSDGEEDVQDDIGALSSDDEEFYVGKKKPISKRGPRKKTTHHVANVFPEPPVHHVRENVLHWFYSMEPCNNF